MQAQHQAARHRFEAPENLSLIWPRVSIFPLVGPGSGAKALSSGPCVAEKSYAQLVFMSTSAGSLWNLHAIHSMCRMEHDQAKAFLMSASISCSMFECEFPGALSA